MFPVAMLVAVWPWLAVLGYAPADPEPGWTFSDLLQERLDFVDNCIYK
jgi:hypothetical protein